MNGTDSNAKQSVLLTNRKKLTIDNVKNVIGFDESYVALHTELGKMIVDGEDLKI